MGGARGHLGPGHAHPAHRVRDRVPGRTGDRGGRRDPAGCRWARRPTGPPPPGPGDGHRPTAAGLLCPPAGGASGQAPPGLPAVSCSGEVVDYAELDRRSSALAGYLRERGIGDGHRVGVFLERSVRLPVVLLAVMKTGAAYVPLDPVYPRTASRTCWTTPRCPWSSPSRGWPRGSPGPRRPAAAGPLRARGGVGHARAGRRGERGPGRLRPVHLGLDRPPQGVRVGHRALTNLVVSMCRAPGVREDDTMLAVTTVCFDIAGLELFAPLVAGAVSRWPGSGPPPTGGAARAAGAGPADGHAGHPATWRMLLDAGWPSGPDARCRASCAAGRR
ncbi:AMP-binding protein [Streptomyces sp. M19]